MTFDFNKAAEAQAEHAKEIEAPLFAPEDGRCYLCYRNIYRQVGWTWFDKQVEVSPDSPKAVCVTGISVERAGRELIIGCPHCGYSFCD